MAAIRRAEAELDVLRASVVKTTPRMLMDSQVVEPENPRVPMTASPNTDLALVMTGGGARAAYQVGFLRTIARLVPDFEPEPVRPGDALPPLELPDVGRPEPDAVEPRARIDRARSVGSSPLASTLRARSRAVLAVS